MNEALSIILPAYNEVENIEAGVSSVLKFVPTFTEHYEVIIVDDGSRDGTGKLIDRLAAKYDRVVALHHLSNRGYGAALRSGFKAARGELIFFTDGDGQFEIQEMPKLMSLIREGTDIACGYRMRRADPLMRAVNAALYRAIVRLLFRLNVKDINCAFKLFKRKIIENLNFESCGALINAELLILAQKKGYLIKEVGVIHYPRIKGKQTGAKLTVILRTFIELLRLWRKLK